MPDDRYVLALEIQVDAADRLWDAAASYLAIAAKLHGDDTVDTIGPRDDPNIADCLAILLQPAALPGCSQLSWTYEPMPRGCAMTSTDCGKCSNDGAAQPIAALLQGGDPVPSTVAATAFPRQIHPLALPQQRGRNPRSGARLP